MDLSKRLGEGSIPRLLLMFSIPAMIAMMSHAVYNVVDRIFVGQAVGPLGIAGIAVSFPFVVIVMAFGMLIGFGATALVSIRLGQHQKEEAEQILGNAAVLLVGIAVIFTTLGLVFLTPLLRLFGATDQILPYAQRYMQVLVPASVFPVVNFGLNGLIRGEGNPRIAMCTLLLGTSLNIILDPIFLFGFGWGMRGAAAATVVAQMVSTLWVLSYFLGGRSVLKFRPRNLRLRWSVFASIVAVGSAPFAMQIGRSLLNIVLNNQLRSYGGNLAISVMGIIYPVMLLLAMPLLGINQGAQPIIGYNYGAGKFDRVKKVLQTAVLAATAVATAAFLVVMIFASELIRLFTGGDESLIQLGTHAIRLCLVLLPIIGFQIVSASYFQAVGKPGWALFLGLSRQVLLMIPAVLILPYFFGLDGIWVAIPTAHLASSLLAGTCLFLELRRLRRREAESATEQSEPAE